jgi:hypothetical protein
MITSHFHEPGGPAQKVSGKKAKEVAMTLKQPIQSGEFFLTGPMVTLPTASGSER